MATLYHSEVILSLSDSVFLGQRAGAVESSPKLEPISRVVLVVDDETSYTAGSGDRTLEVTCPYGTQAMANNILATLSQYSYQPAQATDALLDPAVEIGDALTVDGLYTVIADMDMTFDALMTSDVGAPGEAELQSEYAYISQETAEQIRQMQQAAQQIANAQQSADNAQTSANNAQTSANNAQTAANNAQNTANDALNAAGNAQDSADDANLAIQGWTYSGTTNIDGTKIETGTVTASTLRGGTVQLLNGYGTVAGTMNLSSATSAGYAVELNSNAAMRIQAASGNLYLQGGGGAFLTIGTQVYCGDNFAPSGDGYYSCGTAGYRWSDVYAQNSTIQTSDVNDKTDVEALPEKYLTMMDNITPLRYKLIDGQSGRYHVGFVAQEVEAAMAAAGVDSMEFGGFVKDKDDHGNDIYMLRYGEFIAILWAKIRALEAKING